MRPHLSFDKFLAVVFLFFFSHFVRADEYLNYEGLRNELKAIRAEAAQDMVKEVENFISELQTAERMVALDRKNYYARMELLRAAMSRLNIKAIRELKQDEFIKSLMDARKMLQPIYDMISTYNFYLIGYSHIDLAWLWTRDETQGVFRDTSRSVLDLMKQYPEFIFSQTQPAGYEWMEKLFPEVYAEITQRFKDGRWEFIGGSWVEMDANLPSGESFVRQYLYGKRWFKEKFGVDVKVGWTPDSFGYMGNLPQILKKSGMKAFLTQKINWNDTIKFPHHLFWWEAPDGSRLLTFFPPGGYNEDVIGDVMLAQLEKIKNTHGIKGVAVIYGVGDHGGGPTKQMLDRAFALRKNPAFPKVTFIKAHEFFDKMHDFAKDNALPTVKDELYLQYHRGTYTTQAKTKWNNRQSENLLTTAEKFSSLATLYGLPYPAADLTSAWKLVLFNQMHDILPGSSIPGVYKDSKKDFDEVFEKGNKALKGALSPIASRINTSGYGDAIVVFNPLSWERTDVVMVDVVAGAEWHVLDASGKYVSSQKISSENGEKSKLAFIAEKVPPIGFSVYRLITGTPSSPLPSSGVLSAGETIENDFFKLSVDKTTGHITSLYDKVNKRDALTKDGGAVFQFFEDNPKEYDAWNIGIGRQVKEPDADSVELIEKGPVRAVIRVKKTLPGLESLVGAKDASFQNVLGGQKTFAKPPGESTFVMDIILYDNLPRVDINLDVFWKARKEIAKLAFNVNAKSDFATFEIPYAVLERPTNPEDPQMWARWEESAQKWVDYTEGIKMGASSSSTAQNAYGVSILNDSKYGYDIKGNVMRVTLLRGPIWPDPLADRGRHIINLSLYPHKGDWRAAQTVNRGYEVNAPLIVHKETSHGGELKAPFSFASSSASNVILAVMKKHEDTNDFILRVYEATGVKTNAVITLPKDVKKAEEIDMVEWGTYKELVSPVKFTKNKLNITISPYEIKTIKVSF